MPGGDGRKKTRAPGREDKGVAVSSWPLQLIDERRVDCDREGGGRLGASPVDTVSHCAALCRAARRAAGHVRLPWRCSATKSGPGEGAGG